MSYCRRRRGAPLILLGTSRTFSSYTSFSNAGNAFGALQVSGRGKPDDVSAIADYDNAHGDSDAAQAARQAAAWVNTLAGEESSLSDTAKRQAH